MSHELLIGDIYLIGELTDELSLLFGSQTLRQPGGSFALEFDDFGRQPLELFAGVRCVRQYPGRI